MTLIAIAAIILVQPVLAEKKARDKEEEVVSKDAAELSRKMDDVTTALKKIGATIDKSVSSSALANKKIDSLTAKVGANARVSSDAIKSLATKVDSVKGEVAELKTKSVTKAGLDSTRAELEGKIEKAAKKAASDTDASAQALDKKIVKKLEDTGIIRVGLSIGPRFMLIKDSERDAFGNAVISKQTRFLTIDKRDKSDLVLSAVLAIQPWSRIDLEADRWKFNRTLGSWLRNSTFLVNINLAEVSSEGTNANFNEQIEGGLGYGLALHKSFALGFTVERVFNRVLRKEYVDMANKEMPIVIGDTTLDDLPGPNDDKFFRDDNLTAFSFKFILFL